MRLYKQQGRRVNMGKYTTYTTANPERQKYTNARNAAKSFILPKSELIRRRNERQDDYIKDLTELRFMIDDRLTMLKG